MPKLPRMSGRELIRLLEQFGFIQIRQKGSHIVLRKITEGNTLGTVVPDHKELAEGTIRGILKQAQISVDDFLVTYNS